jgi:D-sedoheptulose 7-phosphate isomerase
MTPEEFAERIYMTFCADGTIFFAGCGGFHAHACHMAAELVVRYRKDRPPIRAMALGCNPAIVSATVNDLGPEQMLLREFLALRRRQDLLVTYSTSGHSPMLLALEAEFSNTIRRVESQEWALRQDHLACEALEQML